MFAEEATILLPFYHCVDGVILKALFLFLVAM